MRVAGRSPEVIANRRGRLSGVGVFVVLLVVTSCTTTAKSTSSDRPEPAAKRSPATPDGASGGAANAAVVSAWLAAEHAFDDAALTADPTQPDLAATTVAPQLSATQALLEQMQASDEVATGAAQYGTPSIRLFGSELAQVTSCVHDAEIVVSASTGKPVPGVPGEVAFELLRSTMEFTGGGWKLASQTVGVGQCSGS